MPKPMTLSEYLLSFNHRQITAEWIENCMSVSELVDTLLQMYNDHEYLRQSSREMAVTVCWF